jgi:hypothetical protein
VDTLYTGGLASGRLIDLVLLLLAGEVAALLWWWRRRRGGIAPPDLCYNAAAGALLLLAVRAALTGSRELLPLWLCAALVAHLLDLARRWRRES